MNQHKTTNIEVDEISFINLLLFLKASCGSVIKSTMACVLAVGAYYFFMPNTFKASATVELAMMGGKPIEAPSVFLERIKLPFYFSPSTVQLCGSGDEFDSQAKFVDKIKPSINRIAPFVTFVTEAKSTHAAKACLDAVIAEVLSHQDAISEPLLEKKKQKILQLNERLKLAEEVAKPFPVPKGYSPPIDEQFSTRNLVMVFSAANALEIKKLREEVSSLENELIAPFTKKASLVSPVYAPETPDNKRPFVALGLCLALGLILGLLVTGVMRVVPIIWPQIRGAESGSN